MKKLILIITLMAGVSFSGKSQHFYASFGVQHQWGVPVYISNVVYDHYFDYNWVHATQVLRNGRRFYDIVLQRGDLFVEVRVGRRGFIRTLRSWDAYPFVGHVCADVCGFHGSFYRNSYTVFNNYNYGYRYRNNNAVVINNHYTIQKHRNNGRHYKPYKHETHRNHVHHNSRNDNRRVVQNGLPERRGRYY